MRFRIRIFPLILAAGVSWAGAAEAAPNRGRRPPPLVIVAKVVRRQVRQALAAVGTVAPYRVSIVSSEISGLVKGFPLKEGDPVSAGKTVIARLKRSDLIFRLRILAAELAKARQDYLRLKRGYRKEEIAALRAKLEERRARLVRDERELKRVKDLFRRQVINRSRYDQAVANQLSSKSQVVEAQSNLHLAEAGYRVEEVAKAKAEMDRVRADIGRVRDELSKAVVRSPLTGFITEKFVEVGQWVQEGGRLAEVIELNKVLVRAPIAERHITRLRPRDLAIVRFDAMPGRRFSGRIYKIIPKADPKSRTFPVDIEIENTPDFAIKAGMFARVSLRFGKAVATTLVPKDAVIQRARGLSVFVHERGRVREVSFSGGRSIESYIEVLEGRASNGSLKSGMEVVVQGNENLRDGMPVRVRKRKKPGSVPAADRGRQRRKGRQG